MTDEGLVFVAAEITRNVPELWKAFLHELKVHAEKQDHALLHAPREILQTAQGAAREAKYLHDLLKDSVNTVDKIKAANRTGGLNVQETTRRF